MHQRDRLLPVLLRTRLDRSHVCQSNRFLSFTTVQSKRNLYQSGEISCGLECHARDVHCRSTDSNADVYPRTPAKRVSTISTNVSLIRVETTEHVSTMSVDFIVNVQRVTSVGISWEIDKEKLFFGCLWRSSVRIFTSGMSAHASSQFGD